MKKFLKIITVVALVFVILLIAASVALRILLPPEKAKALVVKQLSSKLHREVTVGPVSVGVLSGLVISDLKISEAPNFSNGTFVSSDRFTLKVALLPLLSKRIEINELALEHPTVTVIRNANGTFNFSDLAAPSKVSLLSSPPPSPTGRGSKGEALFVSEAYAAEMPGAAPASKGGELPFALLVSHAVIRNGIVHFVDHSPAHQSVDVAPIDLKLTNVSLTDPFGIQTALAIKMNNRMIYIQLSGEANAAEGSFDFKKCQVKTGDLNLSLTGRADKLKTDQPSADLDLTLNGLNDAALRPFAALPPDLHLDGNLRAAVKVSGSSSTRHLTATVDGKDFSIVKTGQFEKKQGVPLSASLSGDYEAARQELNLSSLQAALSSIQLNGTLTYLMAGKAPVFNTALKSNSFALGDLAGLVPMLDAYQLGGTAQLDVHASGSTAQPKANGTLHVTNGSVRYNKSQLSSLDVPVSFTQEDVAISKMTGQLDGAPLTLQLTGHKLVTAPDIQLNANLTAVDLSKLLPPLGGKQAFLIPFSFVTAAWAAEAPSRPLPPMKLSGHLAIGQIQHDLYQAKNFDFKWNLSKVTPDLSQVTGLANLRQGAGVVRNIDELAAVSKTMRMALFPLITIQKMDKNGALHALGIPSLQEIQFDGIRGDYVFDNGVMDIRDFDLIGHDLELSTQGTVGLAGAQPINVHVQTKLAAGSIRGDVGQILQDENGRPTIKFDATGTAANPHVHVDVADTAKRALQQGAKELLKGVLGGQSSPRDNNSGQPSGNSGQQNPSDDLQKALKNIFH